MSPSGSAPELRNPEPPATTPTDDDRERAPSAPLSILHVASPAEIGGLERVLHALAIGHRQRGHDAQVAALVEPGRGNPAFIEPLEAAGVPVHALEVSLHSVRGERAFVRALCRRQQPDVVHTHGYRPDIVDAGVARGLGITSVSTEHGFSKMGGRTAVYEWLQMRLFKRFDGVVAVSARIAESLEQAGTARERIHLIPNAWADNVAFADRAAAREALGLPGEATVIGFVGRMIEAKGGDVFLRALARLRRDASDALPFESILIGDGPERAAWTALAAELELEPAPRFHGALTHAAPLFRAFDLLVLSSRTEGTPITVFEAMAAGVPVAASAVGGVPHVLGDDAGYLVPPDDPSALAAALASALRDPPEAAARAARAMQRLAERFALGPWLDAYERFYRSAIDARCST